MSPTAYGSGVLTVVLATSMSWLLFGRRELADTAMVFAISSAAGEYLPMTTVDQTIHFLKPALRSDLLAQARVVRLGRTMAFGSVSIETASDAKPVALAQTAYAIMRDSK